jgi:tetratricopeptide (TPR) repeat protein
LEIYNKGIKENPESGLLLYAKGATFGQMGKPKEELELYQKAVLYRPNDHRIWNNMGYALEDLGHKNQGNRAWNISDKIKNGARIRDKKEVEEVLEIIKYGGTDPVYKGKAANKALERGQRASSKEEKLKYYHEALGLYSSVGNKRAAANTMNHIAGVHSYNKEWDLAIEFIKTAYDIDKETNYEMFVGEEVHNLGYCYYYLGKFKEAIPFFEESVEIHEKLNDKRKLGDSRFNLGNCYKKVGEYDKAIEVFEICLNDDIENEMETNQANDLMKIGSVYREKGDYTKAIEKLTEAAKIMNTIGTEIGEAKVKKKIEKVKNLKKE